MRNHRLVMPNRAHKQFVRPTNRDQHVTQLASGPAHR